VGDTLGTVLYIDLLSTKMRTPDNLFVRIPNEQVLRSVTVNYTRYPIRRLSIPVGISYDADPSRVREILLGWLQENPYVLADPPPDVWITTFGDSAVDLTVQVWVRREEFIQARNALISGIKQELERHGVEIPYPQQVVHLRPTPEA
jgi:small-conductance mechanosensitive channel